MNQTIVYIDKRLDGMAKSPKTFGGQEAREVQMILLLELRSVATGGNGYDIRANWLKFIKENVDEFIGPKPMHARGFPDTLFDRLLQQFIREQVALQGVP